MHHVNMKSLWTLLLLKMLGQIAILIAKKRANLWNSIDQPFFKRRRFLDSIQMFCSLSAALLYSHFQPSKYLDCFHYLSYSIGTKWENTKCPLDHFCLLDASSFFHDLYFARLIMTFTHLLGLYRTGTLGKYATTYKCYHWPNLKALKFV